MATPTHRKGEEYFNADSSPTPRPLRLVLAGYATFQRMIAEERRVTAERQTRLATARQLAAESTAALGEGFPQRSLLLAVEGWRITGDAGELRVAEVEKSLRSGLASIGGVPLRGHEQPVWTLALSGDGRWLATGAEDKKLLLWNPAQPDAPRELGARLGAVRAVQFSPDSRWLAAVTGDPGVELWDMEAPEKTTPFGVETSTAPSVKILFSDGGRWLAMTWDDGSISLLDLAVPATVPRRWSAHAGPVTDLAFTPDEARLVTASDKQRSSDQTTLISAHGDARVWDLRDASAESEILRGHEASIECLAISPDGKTLLTGGTD